MTGLPGAWQGSPSEPRPDDGRLDPALADAAPAASPGEETIERPIAELLWGGPPSRAGRWLSRWLLGTGAAALVLSVAALVLAFLHGVGPVNWRSPLVVLDLAVLVLVARAFLAAGVPAGQACHGALSVAGLGASALMVLGILLHAAGRLVFFGPSGELWGELLVFGLLGLAGCMVFFYCWAGRGWACRTAAVSAVALLGVIALQPFTGYALLARPLRLAGRLPAGEWPALAALALVTLGPALLLPRRGGRLDRTPLIAWGGLVLAGAALLAVQLARRYGRADASARLTLVAAAWVALALLPVLAGGIAAAWARRGTAAKGRADMWAATGFARSLVALGLLACLAFWIPLHLRSDPLRLLLVTAGILAALTGAWLHETHGEWMNRWALLPAVALAVAALSSLGRLAAFAHGTGAPHGNVWRLGTAALWSPLAVALTFACAGLVVRRNYERSRQPELALESDLGLICTSGWALSGLFVALAAGYAAGSPAVKAGLGQAMGAGLRFLQDLLTLAAGHWIGRWPVRAAALLDRLPRGALLAVAAVVLAALLVVHVLAASRVRWSLGVVAGAWAVPLALATLLAVTFGSRLFIPLAEPPMRTGLGRLVGSRFAARLLLFVIVSGVLARYWEALASVVRQGRALRASAAEGDPAGPAHASSTGPGRSHLGFIVCSGLLASAVVMALALMLHPAPGVEAMLSELAGLTGRGLRSAAGLCARVGQLSAQWGGYAASAAMVALLLVCVHMQARKARRSVYALLATVWVAALAPLIFAWARWIGAAWGWDLSARAAALAALGAAPVVLLIAALTVWACWWRQVRARPGPAPATAESGPCAWAARSLGSVGLMVCVAGTVAVLHGALNTLAPYRQWSAGAAERAVRLGADLAGRLELLRQSTGQSGRLGVVATALAAVAAAIFLLHFLAARRAGWPRAAVYALWCAVALAASAALARAVLTRRPGTWTAGQLAVALAVAALLACIVLALADRRWWAAGEPA